MGTKPRFFASGLVSAQKSAVLHTSLEVLLVWLKLYYQTSFEKE